MKIFCKTLLVKWFLVSLLILLFVGCSESTDEDFVLMPDFPVQRYWRANDFVQHDSVSAYLARGVMIVVHPQASYRLSFDVDDNAGAPNLQLIRSYVNRLGYRMPSRKIRDIAPKVIDGRYVYDFVCEENEKNIWFTTLEKDHDYYKGEVRNVRLEASGAFSDHMSLNLIVVGDVSLNGFTIDELSQQMLLEFREYYTSVVVDTLYVNYAHEHPTLGKKYPADEPWIADYTSPIDSLNELGGWPGVENALDLVLTYYIDDDGVLGSSSLYGGQMGAGSQSTLVLGSHYTTQQGVLPLTVAEIVETAIHETGHYFGLRHTTATKDDFFNDKDYSNYEDGLDDTPYCETLQKAGLFKDGTDASEYVAGDVRYFRMNALASRGNRYDVCPDVKNIMFPISSGKYDGFTKQQLATLRTNLMIFPH